MGIQIYGTWECYIESSAMGGGIALLWTLGVEYSHSNEGSDWEEQPCFSFLSLLEQVPVGDSRYSKPFAYPLLWPWLCQLQRVWTQAARREVVWRNLGRNDCASGNALGSGLCYLGIRVLKWCPDLPSNANLAVIAFRSIISSFFSFSLEAAAMSQKLQITFLFEAGSLLRAG